MGRKRNPKNIGPWDIITDALVDILDGLKIMRTSRDYFNVCYFGTQKELRKACTRILNVLDSMENDTGEANGLSTETGRKKISNVNDSSDGGNGN